MSTRLILVRHGQTDFNLKKRYSGFTDIHLNKNGIMQARLLAARLKGEKIHKIYASDRKRAIHSARIIFKGRRVKKMPQFREMHFGIFEGLNYGQIMQRHPRLYKQWLIKPFCTAIPGGEHLQDFKKRVIRAFQEIISQNKDKTVAVVCHGGVISVYLNYLLKSKKFWKYIPASASLSIVEIKNSSPKVKLLNDTAHL